MVGDELRKLTVLLLIFLALLSGWMVAETEGRSCYKPNPSFKGHCGSDDDCLRFCDGYCSPGRGSCMCPVPC